MVAQFWLDAVGDISIFYHMSPEMAVYFFALMFSVMIGIALGVKAGKPFIGLIGFLGTLTTFTFLGAFPLWILAIPLVIVIMVGYYGGRQ